MAQKKRKHGKVEARKSKPKIRFKLGVLLILIALAFGGCFALYMISATSDPDYWDREIVGSTELPEGESMVPLETDDAVPSAAVNPVPESERADDVHLALCAWVGDVTAFTTYHQTASELVFPDAVSSLTDTEMRSLAKEIDAAKPLAVYLWQQTPADAVQIRTFLEQLTEQISGTPVYILSALPVEDTAENRAVTTWNAALFALADSLGIYYVDVSTFCKGNDGTLAPEYRNEEALYAAVGEEILTHIAE